MKGGQIDGKGTPDWADRASVHERRLRKDYPDDWDPTGYYARKAEHRAEIIPYLLGLYAAGAVIVFVHFITWENNMIVNILVGVACLFIGWNVPQPKFAMRAEDWVRAKLKMSQKTRTVTGTGAKRP